MTSQAKLEYFQAVRDLYMKANRQEKSRLLSEFCVICKCNRKYAIHKLNNYSIFKRLPKKRKPGRHSTYNTPEVLKPLTTIWRASNLPCSKRLKAIIPLWLPYYLKRQDLSPEVQQKLISISPATIDRILKTVRKKFGKHGLCSTKPGSILKTHIPIQTNQWDQSQPGFLEADTVAHCGTTLQGDFVYTLDTVDIATGWTEQRATWGKGQIGVVAQIKDIEESLPFPLLGFDSDNGSEFLNHHLLSYFTDRKKPISWTRSRPYHKDDNAHIEQKNWTHVRQNLGYERFDRFEIVELLNDLYTNEWRLYFNFFLPSQKLISKHRIKSRIVKLHDNPRTPYHRIIDSHHIPASTKQNLTELFQTLDPFALQKAITRKISKIFKTLKNPLHEKRRAS